MKHFKKNPLKPILLLASFAVLVGCFSDDSQDIDPYPPTQPNPPTQTPPPPPPQDPPTLPPGPPTPIPPSPPAPPEPPSPPPPPVADHIRVIDISFSPESGTSNRVVAKPVIRIEFDRNLNLNSVRMNTGLALDTVALSPADDLQTIIPLRRLPSESNVLALEPMVMLGGGIVYFVKLTRDIMGADSTLLGEDDGTLFQIEGSSTPQPDLVQLSFIYNYDDPQNDTPVDYFEVFYGKTSRELFHLQNPGQPFVYDMPNVRLNTNPVLPTTTWVGNMNFTAVVQDPNFAQGGTYYFSATACNRFGCSTYSNEATTTKRRSTGGTIPET